MDTRDITIETVPSDAIAFRVLRKKIPVMGADVVLCTKGVIPVSFTKVTDVAGIAMFPQKLSPEAVKEIPWLFMANIPDSEYAYWKDDVKFNTGTLYIITLKEYTKVPTFWVKMELRDIIGAESFGSIAAKIQEAALGWAGLEVVDVKGVGTRTVTVYFKPPWHESPLVMNWAAWWFCLSCLAICYVLYMLKWSFGEDVGKVVGAGLLILLALGALALAKPAVEKVRERKGG